MYKICAWCKKRLDKIRGEIPDGAPVSHGMCPKCLAKQMAKLTGQTPPTKPNGRT